MPASSLLLATAETAINRLLVLDEDSAARLQALSGKRFTVFIDQLPFAVTMVFSHRLDLLAEYQSHEQVVAQLDSHSCCIKTALDTLPQLAQTSQLTLLIRQNKLHLDGELSIAQQVAGLFQQLDIDVEELVSRYTGDVAAHQLFSHFRQSAERVGKAAERARQGLANALTEEKPVGVNRLAVVHFTDQVTTLRDDVQRFEARLKRLEEEQ